MCVYMSMCCGQQTGIAFVDSTPISVCHNKRIRHHKTFARLARQGKSTMGYFYDFKRTSPDYHSPEEYEKPLDVADGPGAGPQAFFD